MQLLRIAKESDWWNDFRAWNMWHYLREGICAAEMLEMKIVAGTSRVSNGDAFAETN